MTRPEKFEDLKPSEREGTTAIQWYEAIWRQPGLTGLMSALIVMAQQSDLEVGTNAIRIPLNEEEQARALAMYQQRWDDGKKRYEEYDFNVEGEPGYEWLANYYSEMEKLPSLKKAWEQWQAQPERNIVPAMTDTELDALRAKLAEPIEDGYDPELGYDVDSSDDSSAPMDEED